MLLWNQNGTQQNFNIIKVKCDKNIDLSIIFESLGKKFVNIVRSICSLSCLF